MHVVVIAERFVAIRTLARSGRETFFDAVFAENMSARFDRSILEISSAHRAQRKAPQHFIFGGRISEALALPAL